MGRKHKPLKSWASQHEDLQVITSRTGEDKMGALVCKCCSMEMVTDPTKKPYDHIWGHLASARHVRMKARMHQQPTMFKAYHRQRERKKMTNSAIYVCVKASSECKVSLEHTDEPIDKSARNYCPAAKTTACCSQPRSKYFIEVFDKHMSDIKEDVASQKFRWL